MTAPVYSAVTGVPGLYALEYPEALPAGYWAGYYAGSPSDLGDTASLQEAWNDTGGVYLFLGETPADFTLFAAGLEALLPRLSPTGMIRVLWIDDPVTGASWRTWRTRMLDAVPAAAVPGADRTWRVARQMAFTLGAYGLLVQGGTALALADSDASGYGAAMENGGICFYAPGCAYPAQSGSFLNLAGAQAGGFACDLSLANGNGDDMAGLGVMLCFAAADADNPFGEAKRFPMPLLNNAGISLPAALRFDPLRPLDADRTHLGLFDAAVPSPFIPSAFLTTRGYAVSLAASDGGGALVPGRFGFCRTPLFATESAAEAYFDYYLAPDGAFALAVEPPEEGTDGANDLMMGLSGIECVALPAGGNPILFFRCGQGAFVPDTAGSSQPGSVLTGYATTAYAMVLPPAAGDAGLIYYAQPLQAPLFRSVGDLGPGFMDFHAMPSASLPSFSASVGAKSGNGDIPVMPMGAYKWATAAHIEWARALEASVLSPLRRATVGLPPTAAKGGPRQALLPAAADPLLAVTPQGLIAKLTDDLKDWAGITIANMPESVHQEVQFTEVGDGLQAALQSNQLFFVVSNVDNFMEQSSVQYQLTGFELELLAARGVPQSVLDALTQAYGPLPSPVYPTENAFLADYPQDAESLAALADVLAVTGLMECDIEGWTFQISPRSWRQQDPVYASGSAATVSDPTLMVFKFCNRTLAEWVEDGDSWGFREAAWDNDVNQSIAPTQKALRDVLGGARDRYQDYMQGLLPATDPLVSFYMEVALNPAWNGVIFFNAPVDFTQMPDALQFLAAGIDTQRFYAHHLGFSVTPFNPVDGGIDLRQTAAFGLIDYEDSLDLVADASVQFGFKTMMLQVRFANARVADFAAQVELMVNDMFGAILGKSQPERGNNLILNGSYQRMAGLPAYTFTLSDENLFNALDSIVVGVEFLSVQLVSGSTEDADTVVMQFVLTGNLSFACLPDFDLFSYGPGETEKAGVDGFLRFGSLTVRMSFPRAAPEEQTFTVAEKDLSFDQGNSLPRRNSLANNFPLVISQLIVSPNLAAQAGAQPVGQTAEDLGFTSISAPLDQTPMVPTWYGLAFTLDLGTLGALVGGVGFKVSLLAAWSRGADAPVYLGLKLPNIPALGGSIPLQGVLKLGFRSFEFSTYTNEDGSLGYMLTLRRFALSVLCWSFPPGNADIRLFGAPGQPKTALGWYAAYDAGDPAAASAASRRRALPAG